MCMHVACMSACSADRLALVVHPCSCGLACGHSIFTFSGPHCATLVAIFCVGCIVLVTRSFAVSGLRCGTPCTPCLKSSCPCRTMRWVRSSHKTTKSASPCTRAWLLVVLGGGAIHPMPLPCFRIWNHLLHCRSSVCAVAPRKRLNRLARLYHASACCN